MTIPMVMLIVTPFVHSIASAEPRYRIEKDLNRINCQLAGHICDFTNNHGVDRRIWSAALCQRRDLYVYLPPGYDGQKPFPIMLWMHGSIGDEEDFRTLAPRFDELICKGELPPMVIAAVDGSISGKQRLFASGSFYINSEAGRFEDYIIRDVYPFILRNFKICPERESHILAGVSMGGFGAYNLGIKYRAEFAHVFGIFPPLNVRYTDCHGRYSGDYDPNCFDLRSKYRPRAPIARFYGVVVLRERIMMKPLFGNSPDPIAAVARENPYEMLEIYNLRPGESNMYIGYGTKDEFNLGAQIESFLHRAQCRGLTITVDRIEGGRHDSKTAMKLLPGACRFVSEQLRQCAESEPTR